MNKPFRFFLILRLAVYTILIAYLAGDFSLNGPLTRGLKRAAPGSPQSIARAKSNQEIARIGDQSITRSQLDRAVGEALWLQGEALDSLTPLDQQIIRYKALSNLIDADLLNRKIASSGAAPAVSDAEVNARLARLLGRFVTKSDLEAAMKTQGIPDEASLRDRLKVMIGQEKFIDAQIAPLTEVSEEEARTWFLDHQQEIALRERVRARHLFIPTLDVPSAQAKARLEKALSELTTGTKDFKTLAKEVSMDPATQYRAGDLGWMSRDRLPDDFAKELFRLPIDQPTVFQTKLGWHLAEVLEKKSARPQTFEEAKAEIISALRTVKRDRAVRDFRDDLQKNSGTTVRIRHEILNQ